MHAEVSHDTVEAIEFLLHEAKRGELIGLVYGAMTRGRACIIDTAGEAYRNPLFALGVVCLLEHDIAVKARTAEG